MLIFKLTNETVPAISSSINPNRIKNSHKNKIIFPVFFPSKKRSTVKKHRCKKSIENATPIIENKIIFLNIFFFLSKNEN